MNNISIGKITEQLSSFFGEEHLTKLAVLVDENTYEHCYPLIKSSLPPHHCIKIKSGEIHKNLSTCEQIWAALTDMQMNRKGLLLNLGGGVIGDMGGFCAATYKRGIRFVNVPTTLLAAVDANIGGKLGIDFMGFKNHIGLFKHPEAVFIDPIFFNTLPPRELRSGFAEVMKHGLIADANYFEATIENGLQQTDWKPCIQTSLAIKQAVVEADPKEHGLRKILNFGHSIGHAIESHYLEKENRLFHGEAIAIGMICEAYLSTKLLGMSKEDLQHISEAILNIFNDISIAKSDFTTFISLMHQDKKNSTGVLNLSLLYEPGRAAYDIAVDEKDVMDALFYFNQLKPQDGR